MRPLPDYECSEFVFGGKGRAVYRAGSGPAVIVIHEMPGITPAVAEFGRRVASAGLTAVLPSLFGTPGKDIGLPYLLGSMARGCVSREFVTFALNKTSPITAWLLALARDAHTASGGPGVGVVGMCFTGGFALGMMVDDVVVAPALSQPSLPFAIGKKRSAALGVSDADLLRVKERCDAGACVLGMRFTGDWFVPGARFRTLEHLLGERFIGVEIDSEKGNRHEIRRSAHSVVTNDFVDEPGHPTRLAHDRLLAFFAERLLPAPLLDGD